MDSTRFLHLTVANKPHPGLELLLQSARGCSRAISQSRVLGMGRRERVGHNPIGGAPGGGFGLKLLLLKEECSKVDPSQLVLFTDAFDILLQPGGQDSFLQLGKELQASRQVFFAAERVKWPDADAWYPPSSIVLPFPYLNSGVIAGRADSILNLLQKDFTLDTDDQRYYTQQYISEYPHPVMKLDHKARFFFCMQGMKTLQTKGSSVVFGNGVPFVLHLNSGGARIKWMKSVVNVVLGEAGQRLARQLVRGQLWSLVKEVACIAWPYVMFLGFLVFLHLRLNPVRRNRF